MTQSEVMLGEHAFREVHPLQERRLPPRLGLGVGIWAFLVALLVLWQVFRPISQGNQYSLVIFLGTTLPLVFLCYSPARRKAVDSEQPAESPGVVDCVLAVLALLVGLYPLLPWKIDGGGGGYDAFLDRQGLLSTLDVVAGAVLLLLVLEATRRAVGPVLPGACLVFLAYSYYGGYLPLSWGISHSGVDFDQIINGLYNEASGFFGAPLAAAATYIVLFNIYGAMLDASGAGTFFVNLSHSVFRRSRAAAGRTATLSGFLLGTVSGSGTATTVTISAVTWPLLRRSGYTKENAGGLLAASGIGAMLSPPTLGAAAFIIAESLHVSYFDVLVWALVPTLLYYLGIMLAVEADARNFRAVAPGEASEVPAQNPRRLLLRGGYHFASIVIVLVFLALDYLPFYAVVYAIAATAAFALLAKLAENYKTPVRALGESVSSLARALASGVLGALPVVAVCAAAGVVTSTVAKTGLGQVLSSSLVDTAHVLGDDPTVVLALSVLFCALTALVLGLAIPVVASFIIAWVALAPALGHVGVSRPEAAMFLFYYTVLSEVTPPTALAPLAASAVTGGSVDRTILAAWKYTLPAFLVPFAFVLTDNGSALLGEGTLARVLWVAAVAAVGVAALGAATSGWMLGRARWPERVLCLSAALLLLYLKPWWIAAGTGFLVAAVAVHLFGRTRPAVSEASGTAVQKLAMTDASGTKKISEVPERKNTSSWRRRVLRVAAAVLAVGLVAAGSGGKRAAPVAGVEVPDGTSCEAEAGRVTIATANIGGVYYALGGELANLINENTELKATAAETGASGENVQQLVAGDYDIAFSVASVAIDAVTGRGLFDGEPQPIQALARLYPEYIHVLVRTDAGIDSVKDLRGKRISTGSPKSGTEATAHQLLRAAGLDPVRDVQAQRLDLAKTADGIEAGTIDALIWVGGLPTAKIVEITTVMRGQVKFLDVAELLPKMNEAAPIYERADIPAGTYQQPGAVKSIVFPSILLVREDFPTSSACAVTKLIFEKTAELAMVHPAAEGIVLDEARHTGPVPLHPGARQALDALGAPG